MSRIGKLTLVVALVASLAEGAKRECPSRCGDQEFPVCGSDGKTYRNQCLMEKAACKENRSIKFVHYGECDESVAPPAGMDCGGKKCDNYAECKEHKGKPTCRCPELKDCPKRMKYVCGNDGNTYDNECALRVESCSGSTKLVVEHQGRCSEVKDAECLAKRCDFGAICIKRFGKPECICADNCPAQLAPICGTDGKTYMNECAITLANCVKKSDVKVAHKGACGAQAPQCPRQCPDGRKCRIRNGKFACVCPKRCFKNLDPVCGSDGKTYGNDCELEQVACDKDIWKLHHGECRQKRPQSPCQKANCSFGATCVEYGTTTRCVCQQTCPAREEKVCGTDGQTYTNECAITLANCVKKSDVKVARKGACIRQQALQCNKKCSSGEFCKLVDGKPKCVCNHICPFLYRPVCGSDGKTYDSGCQLDSANCEKKTTIKVLREGPCDMNQRPRHPKPIPKLY